MHSSRMILVTATLVAVAIGLATSTPLHAAAGSPVAAYSFDEGAGTTVHDASPLGNDGTTQDTNWSAAGKHGGALAFNGSSSWVTVPDAPYTHVFVARGTVNLEGAGVLNEGDAVRLTGLGGQALDAIEDAEVLIWEMHAAAG